MAAPFVVGAGHVTLNVVLVGAIVSEAMRLGVPVRVVTVTGEEKPPAPRDVLADTRKLKVAPGVSPDTVAAGLRLTPSPNDDHVGALLRLYSIT
jgi:hypothetical protein